MRINSFSSNINFCAYKSKFSEHLEERLVSRPDFKQDVLLTNEFRDVFVNNQSKENYMGSGVFNTVYKIDDYYVMRIPKGADKKKMFFKRTGNSPVDKLAKKIGCYYGNIEANFGDIQIQRNAVGDKDFVIAGTLTLSDYFSKKNYFQKKYLPAFAKLPQNAYNNLAKDIKFLWDNGYSFDMFNPNNFIKVGNEIRVVDEIEPMMQDGACLNTPMLNMLLSPACMFIDLGSEDYKNMQTIVKKSVIAAQVSGMDWDIDKKLCQYSDILHAADINANIKEIYAAVKDLKDEDEINRVLEEFFSKK